MTNITSEERFRQAAESEGGMPVSAGARAVHIRAAVEAGRAIYLDLSTVPEDKRAALVAELKELVQRASTGIPRKDPQSAPHPVSGAG
jgi:hypothetical protein